MSLIGPILDSVVVDPISGLSLVNELDFKDLPYYRNLILVSWLLFFFSNWMWDLYCSIHGL